MPAPPKNIFGVTGSPISQIEQQIIVITAEIAKLTAASAAATSGTVTSVATGSGLTGGPITTTGTISIPALGVTNAMLAGSIAASKLVGTDIATVGTITTGVWNGTAIANANLAHSTVTVGSTSIALGATAATISGMTVSGGTLTGTTTFGSSVITSTGQLLLGSSTSVAMSGLSASSNTFQSNTGLASFVQFAANNSGAITYYGKSRGTVTAAAAVINADFLGRLIFLGDDGSTNGAINIEGAEMSADVDGTVSTGLVPTQCRWRTMNAGGTLAIRMQLRASGGLSLGAAADPGASNFLAAGTVSANTAGSALGDQIIAGAKVSTSTLTKTSSIAQSLVPGLAVILQAGGIYTISGWLHGTSDAAGGIKAELFAPGGTLTATSMMVNATTYNGTTMVSNTTVTALSTTFVAYTGVYTDIYIDGSIMVDTGGTLEIIAAQNVSDATSTTVLAGSTFTVLRNA